MLILLPILSFVSIFLHLLGREEHAASLGPWRKSFMLSAAVWGASLTLVTEGLSLFGAINRLWLALVWLLILVGAGWVGWRKGSIAESFRRIKAYRPALEASERFVLGAIAVICLILLAVGWVSPPNNVDAQLYHMSRVVHWAEDQSLRHYPTAYNHQLLKPIWAETAILNLRVLWGDDRPASLIQWFSMIGCLIGVSGVASLFGASRKTQILASAVALSIPMGILQASSTQNDYVTAFWVTCLGYLVALSRKRRLANVEVLALALFLGLGVLTKGPFFVYAPPLMLWYFLPQLRLANIRRLIGHGLIMCLAVALLNAGFWTRNMITYGGPYGTSEWLQKNLGIRIPTARIPTDSLEVGLGGQASDVGRAPRKIAMPIAISAATRVRRVSLDISLDISLDAADRIRVWREPAQASLRGVSDSLLSWVRRMAQTLAWNLVTPSSAVNELLVRGMLSMPPALGLGPDFQAELRQVAWNHEDTAGNPVHLALVPIALIGLAISQRRSGSGLTLEYALVSLMAYALVPVVIGHGNSIWGLRYQLPFYLLAAPLIGVGLTMRKRPWIQVGLAGGFLVMSLPWVFLNNTRPIIGLPPWPTRIGSIFMVPKQDILLAVDPVLRQTYVGGARAVRDSGCKDVGLRLNSNDLEYAFWWLLDAPQSGVQIETIYTYPYLERYADPAFKPCAIICTICGDRQRLNGLSLTANFGNVSIFVGPNYVPDKDG